MSDYSGPIYLLHAHIDGECWGDVFHEKTAAVDLLGVIADVINVPGFKNLRLDFLENATITHTDEHPTEQG